MASTLPPRPNLDWLRKTARQRLRQRRAAEPDAKLAAVQLELAREHGFSSWRALKAHVEQRQSHAAVADNVAEPQVAAFLKAVGAGDLDVVRASLASTPALANAVGPHPYWQGRPQPLHVAVETARREMFDLLLDSGSDVDGRNDGYEHTSPLALTFLWKQPEMGRELRARGATVGLVEALLSADDALVARLLGTSALPQLKPNGGSILAMARTPFAVDRLLALGAPTDTKDRWGAPPLEAFSRLGAEGKALVAHLQAKGFDATPAEYARMGDRASLERIAVADPAAVKAHGVLREAAGFGHHELVEWLLAAGADVNDGSAAKSWSALHSAAWEGDLRVAKILVAAGADLTVRDPEHGATPAACARVAVEVTNNPACREVAEFLEAVGRGEVRRQAARGSG